MAASLRGEVRIEQETGFSIAEQAVRCTNGTILLRHLALAIQALAKAAGQNPGTVEQVGRQVIEGGGVMSFAGKVGQCLLAGWVEGDEEKNGSPPESV